MSTGRNQHLPNAACLQIPPSPAHPLAPLSIFVLDVLRLLRVEQGLHAIGGGLSLSRRRSTAERIPWSAACSPQLRTAASLLDRLNSNFHTSGAGRERNEAGMVRCGCVCRTTLSAALANLDVVAMRGRLR
jgi:hypothetical protein